MTALLDPRTWLAAALAAALLWGGVERLRGNDARTELASTRLLHAQAQAAAEARQRQIEAQRTQAVQEIADASQAQITALERDLAASRAAAGGLRSAAAAAARSACPRPAAAGAGAGEPDTAALDLLVGVLGRADAAAGELAEYADRARVAGLACEAGYSALTR